MVLVVNFWQFFLKSGQKTNEIALPQIEAGQNLSLALKQKAVRLYNTLPFRSQ